MFYLPANVVLTGLFMMGLPGATFHLIGWLA